MWNFTFVFLVFLLAPAWCVEDGASGIHTNENGEPKVFQEMECSAAGGICLPKESCPPEKVSKEGRCPDQEHLGIVCCHDLPVTETRCQNLGGQCLESCPEKLIIKRAKDCRVEEKCCALV